MYLDTLRGDETENLVAINRVAAFGEFIFDTRQVLVDHQDILVRRYLLHRSRGHEFLRATHLGALIRLRLLAESLQIFVDYLVGIEAFLGDLDVKVRDGLESFLLDIAHHGWLVHVDLPVLEAALQHLLGEFHGLHGLLLQGLLDLYTGLGGDDEVQPIPLRALRRRRDHGYAIAVVQGVFDRNVLTVHFRRHAFASQLRVDGKGEIEDCRSFGQLDKLAGRREDVDLILI